MPTSDIASSRGGCHHFLARFQCGILPVSLRTTQYWNLPSVFPIRGYMILFSDLYSITALTIVVYNIFGICTSVPSSPIASNIRVHFCRCPYRFRITAAQSSSDADRTRPRYLKDDTTVRGAVVGGECHLHLWILYLQMAVFLLLPPSTEVSGGVDSTQSPFWDEHVIFRAAGVVLVALLQDHNIFLHVAVCKVNLEVGMAVISPLSPLHWSSEVHQRLWERDPIGMGLPPWEFGGEVALSLPFLPCADP